MKILVTLDRGDYSKNILKDVARLAKNTLADVIFLGVQDGKKNLDAPLAAALRKYQQDVYSYFGEDELPYGTLPGEEEWREQGSGDWVLEARGMKTFTLRVRGGGASTPRQAIAVARESECDLIVLGCSRREGCEWKGEMNVPLRIAEDAPCSVLVIKQVARAAQIVSILDQSEVSQDSLEMVNQLVTLHDAGLKIVGVMEKKEAKQDRIEQRMVELLRYYNDREVGAWVKLLNQDEVKDYVTTWSREGIVALWMGGKQSLVRKLFSPSMVDRLLETTRSSLLILR